MSLYNLKLLELRSRGLLADINRQKDCLFVRKVEFQAAIVASDIQREDPLHCF